VYRLIPLPETRRHVQHGVRPVQDEHGTLQRAARGETAAQQTSCGRANLDLKSNVTELCNIVLC
jgi:hypothetical protein